MGTSIPRRRGWLVGIGSALEVAGKGGNGGASGPRLSDDQTRQAVKEHAEDSLLGGARRQVDLDLGFRLDDAGGEFDEARPLGIKRHDAPGRALGHRTAHRPQQPISAGMKEGAQLVGRGLVAGGAVRGGVIFSCFDMGLGLAARAIEPLMEVLARPPWRLVTMKQVSLPSSPTSTRAMMRSIRRQLSVAS